MRRFITIVLSAVIAIVIVVGVQYYYYVAIDETPYDDIGIMINAHVPSFIREWGCARLKERFPNQLPPAGCETQPEN